MRGHLYLPLLAALLACAVQGSAFAAGQATPAANEHMLPLQTPAVPRHRGDAGRAKAIQRLERLGLKDPTFVHTAHGRLVFTATDAFGRKLVLALKSGPLKVVAVQWPQASVSLTERDVVRRLTRRGFRIEHIDRRGEVYFVRAERDGNLYHGYIRGGDGTWLRRVCERANNWTRSPGSDRCQHDKPAAWAG